MPLLTAEAALILRRYFGNQTNIGRPICGGHKFSEIVANYKILCWFFPILQKMLVAGRAGIFMKKM